MNMNYISVCSGIEAASVAWKPLGWNALWYSEIEAFPCAVLAHRFPETPNYGDMTKYEEWPDAAVDLLVGGTPCQSFSVAGPRTGMDDARGDLTRIYLRIAARYRPRWVVWENVPGVLSIDGGRAFGAILGELGKLGYGFAYRILNAEYFGVPQRRRRVFVVGHLGDWRRAAAVLFERQSLCGHPPQGGEAGQRIADSLMVGANQYSGFNGFPVEAGRAVASTGSAAHCLNAGAMGRRDYETETFIVAPPLTGNPYGDHESREGLLVTHTLRAEGFDAVRSEDGTGRGIPLVPVAYGFRQDASIADSNPVFAERVPALRESDDRGPAMYQGDRFIDEDSAWPTLPAQGANNGGGGGARLHHRHQGSVRRLTPRECERLQGFPDDFTMVEFRGKPAADGPRYRAIGNSMAVRVMNWIGQRIAAVDALTL